MTTQDRPAVIIKALVLSGPHVPPATIRFDRGLNVIAGPSDTGKTYIAQCIDFMLGGSTSPKTIPEAAGYELGSLSIETGDGESIALERSLGGGAFRLIRGGEATTLEEKHQPDREDTISHLLLALSGFTGRRIRTNARGATRTLSFRDIARLVIVSEEDIIAERSPVLSGQHTSKTAETCVFRLHPDRHGRLVSGRARGAEGRQGEAARQEGAPAGAAGEERRRDRCGRIRRNCCRIDSLSDRRAGPASHCFARDPRRS